MVNVFFVSLLEIVIFCDIKSHHIQDLQQVMVSGPNLNETSIVSGGYGGAAEGIIPTSSIKGKEHLNSSSVWFWSGLMQHLSHVPGKVQLTSLLTYMFRTSYTFQPGVFWQKMWQRTQTRCLCTLYACLLDRRSYFRIFVPTAASLSRGVKCVCQHFNSKRLAFFYRVLRTVAWWMHVCLCNINLLFVLNLL